MKHFLRLQIWVFSLMGLSLHAQLPLMQQINAQVCDSLHRSPVPIEQMKPYECQFIMTHFILRQMEDWNREVLKFVEETGREINEYELFFIYQLEINCPIYRPIADMVDRSFEDDPKARAQYFACRKFMLALMDGLGESEFSKMVSKQAVGTVSAKQAAKWRERAIASREQAILKMSAMEGKSGSFLAILEDYRNRNVILKLEFQFQPNGDPLIDGIAEQN